MNSSTAVPPNWKYSIRNINLPFTNYFLMSYFSTDSFCFLAGSGSISGCGCGNGSGIFFYSYFY